MDAHTNAVLLLTARFSRASKDEPRPLSVAEWGRFARWLRENDLTPEDLQRDDLEGVLATWRDNKVTIPRLQYLLDRSGALALALEKWERAGLWIMTRSDPDYPARLKRRLRDHSPPVLFGCGNKRLLQKRGVAVIGARNAEQADLTFSRELGSTVARGGLSVVSGGARGVDEEAMLGALEVEGEVVGVLADKLLRLATGAKFRHGLMTNNAVLISPFGPEAAFNVGNAMARNKYIYCLADAAVVVTASEGKGGTWQGAVENQRNGWIPLWVQRRAGMTDGNEALVELGGRWLPDPVVVDDLITPVPTSAPLFGESQVGLDANDAIASEERNMVREACDEPSRESVMPLKSAGPQSFFDYFLRRFEEATRDDPRSAAALQELFEVKKTQLDEWLKRGIREGLIKRLTKPVRYQMQNTTQKSLFGARR